MSPTTARRSPPALSPSPQAPAPPSPCSHACGEKRPRPSDDSDYESSHPITSALHKKRKEVISEEGEAVCWEEGEVVFSEAEKRVAELLARASKPDVSADTAPKAEKVYESMDELPDDDSLNDATDEEPRSTAPLGSSPIVYAETDEEEPGSESEFEAEDESPLPTPTSIRTQRRHEADADESAVTDTDTDADLDQPTATTAPSINLVSINIIERLLLMENALQRRAQRQNGRVALDDILEDMLDCLATVLAMVSGFERASARSEARHGGCTG